MKNKKNVSWIDGRVAGKKNELTEISAGNWTLYIAEEPAEKEVSLGLHPEDITLSLTDEGFSKISALNRLKGTVVGIEDYKNYNLAEIDFGSFSLKVAITDTSIKNMDLSPDKEVYATFKATAPVLKE